MEQMEQEQKTIHQIIGCVALLISVYAALISVVWLNTEKNFFVWNVFPYLHHISVWFWLIYVPLFVFFSLLFVIQPICEVLTGLILWIYCKIDSDSSLYDNFELQIIKEEEPQIKYRASRYTYTKTNKTHDDYDDD
jgi:hypothetical protein